MRTYFLYTLNDPIYNEIRYVGITCNMENRLYYHLKDNGDTKKTRWINKLRENGYSPTINEVKRTHNVREVIQWEIDTIKEYKKIYNLTNSTSGGEYFAIGTPIDVYTLDGIFIDTFTSMIEATEFYGLKDICVSSISACCLKKRRYAYGKIWRYVGDAVTKDDLKLVNSSLNSKKEKHFYAISYDGSIIKEFFNIKDGAIFLSRSNHNLYKVLKHSLISLVNGFFICKNIEDYQSYKNEYDKKTLNLIDQFDKNGVYITTFKSALEAARSIGHPQSSWDITKCCKNEYRQSCGYMWKYHDGVYEMPKYERKKTAPPYKRVYKYSLDGSFIKEYTSTLEASYEFPQYKNVVNCIRRCAAGVRNEAYGYKWSYIGPTLEQSKAEHLNIGEALTGNTEA